MNVWDEILERMRADIPEEDFRRWFGTTYYASDSGDQITAWVSTESIRRHIAVHYGNAIAAALEALGRSQTHVRLVVSGVDDDED